METVNLQQKFALFSEHYKPHIVGEVNDCYVKVVKLKGEFIWHHHDHEDELFLVVKGTLRMKFRDHESVIREGEFVIVPRKVEHMPVADEEFTSCSSNPNRPSTPEMLLMKGPSRASRAFDHPHLRSA